MSFTWYPDLRSNSPSLTFALDQVLGVRSVHQIRIFVDGMAVAIPTALVVLTGDEAMEVADRLNARLGLDRAAWSALAAKCLRDGALH